MINLQNVTKTFGTGIGGLSDVTLSIEKGDFVFLVGPTGSGKTTLFRLLIRELLPTSGTILVSDLDIVKLPKQKIPHLRKKVGVIFQNFKLLYDRTISENILLPLEVAGVKSQEALKVVHAVMEQVGIATHKDKFPIQLSGGELQRAAIARSLVLSPEVLLADEPTGNLDPTTGLDIVNLLVEINKTGTTVVMATHNEEIVNKLKKHVVALEKGKVVRDEKEGKYAHS